GHGRRDGRRDRQRAAAQDEPPSVRGTQMSDAPTDKRTDYLTAKQLADVLQVSETTIHRLRRTGRIPAVYVTDRLARYVLKDVRRALARTGDRAAAPEPAA